MNSLLKFIIRYSFTISFILIEIICCILIFNGNNFHYSKYINASNVVTGKISENWNKVSDYTKLRKINNELAEENQRLKNTLEKYRADNIPSLEKSNFEYISTKVVWVKYNQKMNYLTINKGSKDKISRDMGVVGPKGVVGIVHQYSENYSSVLPIINSETKISSKLSESDYIGSLIWEDEDDMYTATLTGIPGHADVEEGYLIVTSNLSSIFPENIPIGTVKNFEKNKSSNFYKIKVSLFTDFSKINYVYVIKNEDSEERNKFNFE